MPELNDAVQTAVDLGQKLARPVTDEPVHYAVVPEGAEIVSLEQYQFAENPIRKRARVDLYDVASFVTYFNDFKDEDSRIFANADSRAFDAILDYHEAADGKPRFLEHRMSLKCRTTEEWDTWHGGNNKPMEQTAFALFIEDNVPDIVRPSGAEMLESARALKAKKSVDFSSDVNLANGQVQFRYQENIEGRVGGGELEVPESFTLKFPVFWNGPVQEIEARLRWRITAEKKLVFWYTLIRAKKILENAFIEMIEAVEKDTKAVVLLGKVG